VAPENWRSRSRNADEALWLWLLLHRVVRIFIQILRERSMTFRFHRA
jgi:hypothetical protein